MLMQLLQHATALFWFNDHMTLFKTSLLNGISVIIKMITLLGINKVLAVYVGPSGYAALGQFQNVVQMVSTFASGAINTGVTKYTAENYEDVGAQHKVWRTATNLALVGTATSALIIVSLHEQLAIRFLNDAKLGNVFLWFAGSLVLFVGNALLLAILNGKKEIHRLVLANIAGSVLALLVTALLVVSNGLYGALIALAIYQSVNFVATFLIIRSAKWFKYSLLFGRWDKATALNLGKFSAMALTSAACVPVSHILIRDHLGAVLGWTAAGYWEAMWRLSSAYLLLVTTTLSVYFLPRLAELKKASEIRLEITSGYKLLLPIAVLFALLIYFFRDLIVSLLFTTTFYPMRELFAWQLAGDLLRVGSWIIAYLMLSKAMYKPFMITEIVFSLTFVVLTYLLVDVVGITGVVVAYAVNYLVYWAVVYCFVFRKLKDSDGSNVVAGVK